jgi:transposase
MAQSKPLVGIDVSKAKVDASIRPLAQRRQFEATQAGEAELIAWLRQHRVRQAVMEASGGYERRWAAALRQADIAVQLANPKRVRHFAEAAGCLAKNDPIDADLIAWFGETFPKEQALPHDPEREDLQAMVVARHGLIEMQQQLANRGEHEVPKVVQQAYGRVAKALARAVAKLEAATAAAVKAKRQFAERAEIIESVPGLGMNTAAVCIARLPELGMVSGKAIAALLGGAPYDDDSGEHRGARHIKGGRRDLRSMLYMAIVGAATQHNPALKAFYQRLRARGKEGKVAIIACMRKLIVILNTMVARGEKWDPSRYAVA